MSQNKSGIIIERTQIMSHAERLALSLIAYAHDDEAFASHLQALVAGFSRSTVTYGETFDASLMTQHEPLLTPSTYEHAIRRADWLADQIERQSLPESPKALALLSVWGISRTLDEPKAIVLGLKIGVMPIGIFGEQKLQEKMPIIARADVLRGSVTTFTDLTARASLSALHKALDQVSGNARLLEPEMGDWLYGEKGLTYYEASATQIETIHKELGNTTVINALVSDEDGPAVLAMSPSVNSDYPEAHWDLDPTDV